jgi:hypothetical protein
MPCDETYATVADARGTLVVVVLVVDAEEELVRVVVVDAGATAL